LLRLLPHGRSTRTATSRSCCGKYLRRCTLLIELSVCVWLQHDFKTSTIAYASSCILRLSRYCLSLTTSVVPQRHSRGYWAFPWIEGSSPGARYDPGFARRCSSVLRQIPRAFLDASQRVIPSSGASIMVTGVPRPCRGCDCFNSPPTSHGTAPLSEAKAEISR
jgi:hypothetical protein